MEYFYTPHYEGLAIKDLFAEFGDHQEFLNHMPTFKDAQKLKRVFIMNVAAVTIGPPFKAWVKDKILERHSKMTEVKNLNMTIDPQVYEVLSKSKHVAGKYHRHHLWPLPFFIILTSLTELAEGKV